jgi:hypothetical protein
MSEHSTLPPDMRPVRSFGYKEDPPDDRDFPVEELLGAAARPDVVIPASLVKHVVGVLDQRSANACVGFALARSIHIALRVEAERRGHDPSEIPLPSPAFLYANARIREYVEAKASGRAARPIEDSGSYPRLAMKALRALGFCPEGAYPYSVALQHINAPPPPTSFRHAFDMSGTTFYRISEAGIPRVAAISRALAQGHPVMLGLQVDEAFTRNRGERVESIDSGALVGGHAMAVVAVDVNDVTVANSWGASFGDMGLGRIANAVIGSPLASDVYALSVVPPFSRGAA